jgi:hypothetical protein
MKTQTNSHYNIDDHFINHPVRFLKFILDKFNIFSHFKQAIQDNHLRKGKYDLASLLMCDLFIPLFRCNLKIILTKN